MNNSEFNQPVKLWQLLIFILGAVASIYLFIHLVTTQNHVSSVIKTLSSQPSETVTGVITGSSNRPNKPFYLGAASIKYSFKTSSGRLVEMNNVYISKDILHTTGTPVIIRYLTSNPETNYPAEGRLTSLMRANIYTSGGVMPIVIFVAVFMTRKYRRDNSLS